MAGYKVRAAEPEDCEEIIRMIQDLAEHSKMSDDMMNTAEGLRRDGFDRPSPLFQCLVAEAEDVQKRAEGPQLVGYTLSYYSYSAFKGRSLFLENIYVVPQYRGKGIGSKLLTATAELCLSLGCAYLLLSVHNWNQPAISFYQSCGGRNMSDEKGWRTIRFLPNDLQRMVSKNGERAGDPGLS